MAGVAGRASRPAASCRGSRSCRRRGSRARSRAGTGRGRDRWRGTLPAPRPPRSRGAASRARRRRCSRGSGRPAGRPGRRPAARSARSGPSAGRYGTGASRAAAWLPARAPTAISARGLADRRADAESWRPTAAGRSSSGPRSRTHSATTDSRERARRGAIARERGASASSRRPVERPAAHQVEVQVVDGLAAPAPTFVTSR